MVARAHVLMLAVVGAVLVVGQLVPVWIATEPLMSGTDLEAEAFLAAARGTIPGMLAVAAFLYALAVADYVAGRPAKLLKRAPRDSRALDEYDAAWVWWPIGQPGNATVGAVQVATLTPILMLGMPIFKVCAYRVQHPEDPMPFDAALHAALSLSGLLVSSLLASAAAQTHARWFTACNKVERKRD